MIEKMLDRIAPVFAYLLCALLPFFIGVGITAKSYQNEIARMEKAQAEAIAQAEKKNAQGLSKATDTINLASAEYNDLRAELDRARARLRHANSRGSTSGDSADALGKRVAELEAMVHRLVDSGSKCGELYQRCARNHDALVEAIK